MGGPIEIMMAPGYSSCNPVITECTTLHRASACTDSRRVTMRAMACESSVALKPWPAVQHPNHRYVPSLLYSRDYNICCCQKKGKTTSLFPCRSHSFCQAALCDSSGGLPWADVFLLSPVLVRYIKPHCSLLVSLIIPPEYWPKRTRSSPFYFNSVPISPVMKDGG